jgi:hypothetical protein
VLFGAVVLVGIVGILTLVLDPGNPWFDLDSELGLGWPPSELTLALPALWSALAVAFAGLAWLAVGCVRPVDGTRVAALCFGILLLFLAFDEMFEIHERLEARTGIDWQLIYMPVAAVAMAVLAVLVWRLRHRGHNIPAMLVGGALCWAIANALEYVQWRGDEKVELYVLYVVPEELLELVAPALFALAAIATLQSMVVEWRDGPPPMAHTG